MIIPVKMVIADETKWTAWGPARVLRAFGYNNNAADDRYLQFHAKPAAALANGDVPYMASLFMSASAPISWQFQGYEPLWLPELTIAVSSTETSYTAITNTGVDITILVDTEFPVTAATTLVGDLTTGVADRQIWADSAGPKRLLRLDIKNNAATTVYPFVFAEDSPDDNDAGPVFGYTPGLLTTVQKNFSFGRDGIVPLKKSPSTSSVMSDGCTVKIGNNPAIDFDFESAAEFNIRAIYE